MKDFNSDYFKHEVYIIAAEVISRGLVSKVLMSTFPCFIEDFFIIGYLSCCHLSLYFPMVRHIFTENWKQRTPLYHACNDQMAFIKADFLWLGILPVINLYLFVSKQNNIFPLPDMFLQNIGNMVSRQGITNIDIFDDYREL